MKPFYSLLIVAFCMSSLCLEAKENATAVSRYLNPSSFSHQKDLFFIENKGQVKDQDGNARPDVQYQLTATSGLTIFIGSGAIHYQFCKTDNPTPPAKQHMAVLQPENEPERTSYTVYRMDVELVGADKHAAVITEQQQNYYENYYTPGTGDNGAKALAWKKITYKEVYPHIDWVLYTREGRMKHEFVVRRGGRVSDIQLKYGGATDLRISEDGSMEARTPQGIISEEAPVTSQADGKVVSSSYKLTGDVLGYETAAYEGDLLIDPTLLWATYYGGLGSGDRAASVVTDGSGGVYMAGETNSLSGIATSGAYLATFAGGWDAFLVKFDASGIRQWGTYYGGSSSDYAYSVAIDGAGNIYMTGRTTSTSGIASPGAHQTTYGGAGASGYGDAFLVKFDVAGMRVWATYDGGTDDERESSVVTDGAGNVYMTGGTQSTTGIATPGAYQTAIGGSGIDDDAFLVKFDGAGIRQWATYYGGIGADDGFSVATDGTGNVYMAGGTSLGSPGFASAGAYQTAFGGGFDAFLVKFDGLGTRLWATYYGGAGSDQGNSVATDGSGNVYMAGSASSTSGIASAGAFQTANAGAAFDGFLVKFDGLGMRQWATYYGGPGMDQVWAVNSDAVGNVYMAGYTNSTSGIAAPGAYQPAIASAAHDAFLVRFNSLGARQWATYYGGTGIDIGNSIATDGLANVYLAGETYSATGIASTGAHQTTLGGTADGFLAVFNDIDAITGGLAFCQGTTTTLSDPTPGGTWSSGSTGIASVGSASGIVSGVTAGTAIISYTIGGNSVIITVTVEPLPSPITGLFDVCQGASISLSDITSGGTWSSGSSGIASVMSATGVVSGVITGSTSPATATITYQLTATGCKAIQEVTVHPQPSVSGPLSVCELASISLTEASGAPGAWNSGATGIASVGSVTGVVTGAAAGTAMISYTGTGGCYSAVLVTVMAMPAAIAGPASVCGGRSITLSSGTGGGWYISPATAGTINSSGVVTGAATAVVVPAVVSYSLSVCGVSYPITVNPQPVITGPSVVCHYATITLTEATGTTGAWSAPAAAVSATGVVTGTATGVIPITYTATVGGCVDIKSVSVNPVPVPITGSTTVCQMRTTTLADADPAGAWSSGSGAIASITAAGVVSGVLPGTAAISYSFPATGCFASATVTVLAAPVVSLTAGGPTSFCPGGSVTLSATPGFTYQWLDGGVPISSATGSSYVASTSGSFAVTATNAAGCSATMLPIVVSAGADPVIIPSGLVYFCQGGSTTLTASTGSAVGTMTYQWSRNGAVIPGATSVTFAADTVGIYTCFVTLTSGSVSCSGTTPAVTVTVVPRPLPTIHPSGTAFVTSDHSYVTYRWFLNAVAIPGAISWSVVPVLYGSYRLEVTDNNGCTGYSTSLYYGPGGVITETGTAMQERYAIYPNPATSVVYIDAPVRVRAVVTGMEGKTLIDRADATQVDVSGLPRGVYLISLYNDNEQRVFVGNVVK